jgi:uncharacterized membrane protein YfcA
LASSDPEILKRIVGCLILGLATYVGFRKKFGIHPGPARMSSRLTSLAGLPLGFYESFFGSGNGLFTAAILTTARGFDLIQSFAYYYVMAFVWCSFASILYIKAGNLDFHLVMPACIGSGIGAWIGSKTAKKCGTKFVKWAFVAVGVVLGAKLALGL